MKDIKLTQLLRLLAVAVLLSFLAACSDDDDKKPEYGTLDSLFQDAKIRSCGVGCHEPEGLQPDGPDLRKANFRNSLVDKYADRDYSNWAIGNSCSSSTKPYVKLNDLDNSSILQSISTEHHTDSCTGVGFHDNAGEALLSGSILEEFIYWIKNGAN